MNPEPVSEKTLKRLRSLRNASAAVLRWHDLNRQGKIGLVLLVFFLLLALLGPWLSPYDPKASILDPDGRLKSLAPPSFRHPLGTTWQGRDVLSQVLCSSRPTLFVGFTAAFIIVFIGVNVGLLSGYYGGVPDLLLMRVVDVLYGLPFLPLMVVLLSLAGRSQGNIILCIGIIAWRDVTRIVRSQVLSIRELPYIKAAKAMGAGDLRVMYIHIFPNILPMAILFLSFGVVWSILAHADISFLGFGDPETLTWGGMIYSAWSVGVMTQAYWWYVPPAFCIACVASGAFFFARAFEETANPRLKDF